MDRSSANGAGKPAVTFRPRKTSAKILPEPASVRIAAMYAGKCLGCGRRYDEGETILLVPGSGGYCDHECMELGR